MVSTLYDGPVMCVYVFIVAVVLKPCSGVMVKNYPGNFFFLWIIELLETMKLR